MIAMLSDDTFSAGYFVGGAVLVLLSLAVVIWWTVTRLFFKKNVQKLYLWKEGQQHGPYATGDIRGWLSSGQLQATDLACYAGAANWTPLSSLTGIGVAIRKPGPPTWVMIVAVLVLFGAISGVVRRVTAIAASLPVNDKIQWQTVSEGGFSVSMPGKPVKNEETASSATAHTFTVDVDHEEYFVSYTEYPHTQQFDSVDPAKLFDFLRDKMISTKGGKVLSERTISLNNYPGRETVIEDPTEGSINLVRAYWVKPPRLYTIMFIRLKSQSLSANGQKFLDSLKILSQQ